MPFQGRKSAIRVINMGGVTRASNFMFYISFMNSLKILFCSKKVEEHIPKNTHLQTLWRNISLVMVRFVIFWEMDCQLLCAGSSAEHLMVSIFRPLVRNDSPDPLLQMIKHLQGSGSLLCSQTE